MRSKTGRWVAVLCAGVAGAVFGWFLFRMLFSNPAIRILATAFATPLAMVSVGWSVNRLPAQLGPDSIVGSVGVVIESVSTQGRVRIGGELWSARSVGHELLPTGTEVVVHSIQGLILEVGPAVQLQV